MRSEAAAPLSWLANEAGDHEGESHQSASREPLPPYPAVLQAAVHSGHLTVNSRSVAEALIGIVALQMSGPAVPLGAWCRFSILHNLGIWHSSADGHLLR